MFNNRLASPSAAPTTSSRAFSENAKAGNAFANARENNSAKSSSASGLRTYTAARDSNAPLTSNDGFSVVAPIKVTSPRSTNGRNASCCALLKRWTSSTNRMVARPDCWRTFSACATASRISLTPDRTAESAMNSASNAFAIKRASVVLPTPGGPHRIIECNFPDSYATRSGLSGPSRCRCPTTSSSFCGRINSANGAAGCLASNRSVI